MPTVVVIGIAIGVVAFVALVAAAVWNLAGGARAEREDRRRLAREAEAHDERAQASAARIRELEPRAEYHRQKAVEHAEMADRHTDAADTHAERAARIERDVLDAGQAAVRHGEQMHERERKLA